jgi:SagB-type dehydrogenase family enzyme
MIAGSTPGRLPLVAPADPKSRVLRYHEGSTHHLHRFAPGPGLLDWANQPEPFRTWEGAPRLALPLADETGSPSWDALHRPGAVPPRPLDRAALGAFLELTLGLTAWKQLGASRWALRANPSSGNLHPTEGYVVVGGADLPAGVYHYLPRDHVLERRLTLSNEASASLLRLLPESGFLFGLATIHWREAWKYGVRAFRYCQHDTGHALAGARYAAAALGWTARLLDAPGDDDIATLLGLDRGEDRATLAAADCEEAEALVLVAPPAAGDDAARRVEDALDTLVTLAEGGEWSGRPNALSPEHVAWPEIDAVARATRKPRTRPRPGTAPVASRAAGTGGASGARGPASGAASAVRLVRQRRSAVAMDGTTSLPVATFAHMLARLLPRPGVPPWDAVASPPRVHPVFFVHRVDGLSPGLYVLERDPGAHETLRPAWRSAFLWRRPPSVPPLLRFFLLEEGDARSFARLASCQQEIASDSAFSLGMVGLFDPSLTGGPWEYRRLFWEAGMLGQALYLEAEAAGVRATGIGCYFDDVVHEVLGLEGPGFRDLYHFTVGGALDDPRLSTLPAYPEEIRRRT